MAKLISLALAFILSCIIVFPAASLTSPLEYLLRSDKSKPNSWIQSHPLLIPSNGTTIYAVTQGKNLRNILFSTFLSPMSNPSASLTGSTSRIRNLVCPFSPSTQPQPLSSPIRTHRRLLTEYFSLCSPIIHFLPRYQNTSWEIISHTMSFSCLQVIPHYM